MEPELVVSISSMRGMTQISKLLQRMADPKTKRLRLMKGLEVGGSLVTAKKTRVTRKVSCLATEMLGDSTWLVVRAMAIA